MVCSASFCFVQAMDPQRLSGSGGIATRTHTWRLEMLRVKVYKRQRSWFEGKRARARAGMF